MAARGFLTNPAIHRRPPILQAGLVIEAAAIVEEAPDLGWTVYQLSSAVGYESFMTPLLGAVTLIGTLVAIQRGSMRRWFWWLTAVIAPALTVGGILEGLGVLPGRFAIFFGLWAFIAGFALSAEPTTEETASAYPAICAPCRWSEGVGHHRSEGRP